MNGQVVVIGGANVDIVARSDAAMQLATSNPGRAGRALGGVARNIAENLARLGSDVALVSAFGDDAVGREVIEQTAASGVHMQPVMRPDCRTGTYTAVLGPDGELVVAVADTRIVAELEPQRLPADLLADAACIVMDANLPLATIEHVLSLPDAVVMIDPASVPKARHIAPVLRNAERLHTITPNCDELAALTGLPTEQPAQIERAANTLLERGVQRVWVRLGAEGSVLIDADGSRHVPAIAARPVNVTGAGDSMLAAYVHALQRGKDAVEAVRDGTAAAWLTITSEASVRPDMSEAAIARVRDTQQERAT